MDQKTQPRRSGSYTANLLGNIRSHLASLQGYDVMALELIQNADDAKAEEITFDVTDRGLLVRNSGQFTYCGDLRARPCVSSENNGHSCDYHRIADVGSGGKLSNGENIGRFGIGFVSTYQVTDHPEIRSSSIKLTFHPEEGQWFIETFDEPNGTSFFLPWADNPNTEARLALGISHVSAAHIDQLTHDFQRVLRSSLLFLRHVRKAEVHRNGNLLLACDLDRGEGSDLIVSFRPSREIEHWHILRTDAADAAERLYATHPRLKALNRSSKITIGLRIEPQPLEEGLLYAFLPTEQSTGLPLHINADFFPESDRKAVIFAGHQHEQAWNEMLIAAAAADLARDPEGLLSKLGHVQLWEVFGRAYSLSSKLSGHPPCFHQFWDQLKATGAEAHIAPAQDDTVQRPRGVFLPRNPLNADQAHSLVEIGGRLAAEELRPYQTAMNQLGAPILTLERLVGLLEVATAQQVPGRMLVDEQKLEHFYRPLWGIVNDLLPEAGMLSPITNPVVRRLRVVPFVLTEDLFAVTIIESYLAPPSLDAGRVAALLPQLAIASHHLLGFAKIARLIGQLELGMVVSHIASKCASEPLEDVIGTEPRALRGLYTLFAELDDSNVERSVYQELRGLPIWQSSRGLIKASQVLLPGNFTDPTGQAHLLDPAVFTESARDFVSNKLGVRTQTIEAFVQTVLPTFFNDAGPLDEKKYARVVSELASHAALVNDESIRRLLGSLAIVPTMDGGWSNPTNTYRRTETLVKVLGDALHLWLDPSRIPNIRSVAAFLDNLGILRSPSPRHLVDRMLFIAEKYLPTEDARRASGDAFYVLCENYDVWKNHQSFEDAIWDLRHTTCFPAEGDTESWHTAGSLYGPYRADAFRSQAHILDFRNTVRLKAELLQDLGISVTPETRLVVDHLQHCVATGTQPHVSTYQVLNERALRADPLIKTLAGSRCIYVESQKLFVRPNQLYWSPQQLGRYAFTIPDNLGSFKPLFAEIGVKSAPEAQDFVDIILDIVGEYFEQSKPLAGPDRAVYDKCLDGTCAAEERGELASADLLRLQEAPAILNIKSQLTHHDEVLLQDSEWHTGFFGEELDQALCRPAPELWSLFEKVGVRRLSESARVALEFVDGSQADEGLLASQLMERIGILTRLLHDKPTHVREKVRKALSELKAISYEVVRIQASVRISDDEVFAPPAPAHAFYDIDKRCLILARPVGDRIWPHILNALFHQLMPEESGTEISKLTLMLRPLVGMSVEEAHRELTDAGIPLLDAHIGDGEAGDITSHHLGDLGSAWSVEQDETQPEPECSGAVQSKAGGSEPDHEGADVPTGNPPASPPEESSAQGPEAPQPSGQRGVTVDHVRSTHPGELRLTKPRAKHKEQWDRRLLSYVRKSSEDRSRAQAEDSASEHNLRVEAVARAAVCSHEKFHGRLPEQMAQTHPGYDIISRNPLTGEERFIEVKGVNGEWNRTGVGLSRLQFSNAQECGDRFWLYVVEFVGDRQHTRVHAIQSPATQVTSFMFDGNWRDAVTEECADPATAFIVGAKVRHPHWGHGRIITMQLRGSTRVMAIDFKNYGRRTVTLNLHTMSVAKDDDDNDHS